MAKAVYINCNGIPFVDLIMMFQKPVETRNRNTLRTLTGERVYIAETRNGRKPLVRCSLVFGEPAIAETRAAWETVRNAACIPAGHPRYDWNGTTRRKVIYPISDVHACDPFILPEGVRHGRVWMEFNDEEVKA